MILPSKADAGRKCKKYFRDLNSEFFCRISNLGQTGEYDLANPGYNTALLDVYHIRCLRWQDPNQHAITKYIFKGKIILHLHTSSYV